jgi:hypothetical protein
MQMILSRAGVPTVFALRSELASYDGYFVEVRKAFTSRRNTGQAGSVLSNT